MAGGVRRQPFKLGAQARGQQAGKGARLRRCGACPCLVKEVAWQISSFLRGV
jgi:hypothetical protein